METLVSPGIIIDGSFEVIRFVGAGATASVYLAKHLTMNQMVAIKILSAVKAEDKDAVKRFQREAIAIAKLDHPHIVKILKTGTWNDRPYLCMEYLDGQTLEQRVESGKLEASEVRRIGTEICDALAHAHESGIIHRDVKPGNILLFGSAEVSKLTDFGIAKVIYQDNQGLTATGEVLGTPAYMSPEQLLNKTIDHRSDIYSLACVLYECLSGQPPFPDRSAYQVAQSHLSTPPIALPEYGDLGKVILKALSKSPDDRYQSSLEFKKVLQSLSGERLRHVDKRGGASKIKFVGVVLLLIALVGSVVAFSLRKSESDKFKSSNQQRRNAASTSMTPEEFQDTVEKLKTANDDVDKARLLKDAYSYIESSADKTISRSMRLLIKHDYACLLLNHHLTNPALEIFTKILADIEKNGRPKPPQDKKEAKFSISNLLNCQSKTIEILYKRGELVEAKTLYKELRGAADKDNPSLLRAAILLKDKKTIAMIASQKPNSENAAIKLAHIFLEQDLIDELGTNLKLSFEVSTPARTYNDNQADLMIVQAKYFLLQNEPTKAVQLVKNFWEAKTPSLSDEKREQVVQHCAEILCVASEFSDARKLLVSMHLEEGPSTVGEAGPRLKPTDHNAESTLNGLQDTTQYKQAREVADYVLTSPGYSNETKAMCALIRSKRSHNRAVLAYYVCLAHEFAKGIPNSRKNAHLKLLTDYSYADTVKYLNLYRLAEPIFSKIVSQNDLAQVGESDKTYIEVSLSNELQILHRRQQTQKTEELLRNNLAKMANPVEIHTFIEALFALKDDQAIKNLIENTNHFHDLVWAGERCLDHGRPDLAVLCLNRESILVDKANSDRDKTLAACCKTILGALCALSEGNTKEAQRYFEEHKTSSDSLDEFTRTYAVLKALSY